MGSLYQALSNHPEREFANKLFSELSGRGLGLVILVLDPHAFQITYPVHAYLNPEVVRANLNDKVSNGHTMSPFSMSMVLLIVSCSIFVSSLSILGQSGNVPQSCFNQSVKVSSIPETHLYHRKSRPLVIGLCLGP